MAKPIEKNKPTTVAKEKAKQWGKSASASPRTGTPTAPSAGPAKGTGPQKHNPPKR